jgi:hypothetical protein
MAGVLLFLVIAGVAVGLLVWATIRLVSGGYVSGGVYYPTGENDPYNPYKPDRGNGY